MSVAVDGRACLWPSTLCAWLASTTQEEEAWQQDLRRVRHERGWTSKGATPGAAEPHPHGAHAVRAAARLPSLTSCRLCFHCPRSLFLYAPLCVTLCLCFLYVSFMQGRAGPCAPGPPFGPWRSQGVSVGSHWH